MKQLLKPLLTSILMIQGLTSISQAYTCKPLKTQMGIRSVFNLENQITLRLFAISHIQDSLLTALTTGTKKGEIDFEAILFVVDKADGQRSGGFILGDLERVRNASLRVGANLSQHFGEPYIDFSSFPKESRYSEAVALLHSTPVKSLVHIDNNSHPFDGIYAIKIQDYSSLIEQCIKSEDQ